MVYFSFIGNHDRIEINDKGPGAVATIFLQYKDKIDQVFLFVTPAKREDNTDYRAIAEANARLIRAEKSTADVELVHLELANPVDFDLVYPRMLDALLEILDQYDLHQAEKIINITSGTPTMTTCWVLLERAGVLAHARLVQSFEARYARERGRSTREVIFAIDDFPQIQAPAALKRQLTLLNRENIRLTDKVKSSEIDGQVPELIGHSARIREIKEQILCDINTRTHVLITGERGTGKQVVAEAIWRLYHQKGDDRLVTFDCGAFSRELITSELFGYKKGAFTGALQDSPGIIRQCRDRFLFLDEIGNLPLEGQHALLRFINDGEIRSVGAFEVEKIRTQIIAATNKEIEDPALFAQDLRDRFDECISLPPLRDRREDIPALVQHFIPVYTKAYSLPAPIVLEEAILAKLMTYAWPGNVRELEKWISRICRRFNGGSVRLSDLPQRFIIDINQEEEEPFLPPLPLPLPLDEYIERIRAKARLLSHGNMAGVDRLLLQPAGTERQRQFRKRRG